MASLQTTNLSAEALELQVARLEASDRASRSFHRRLRALTIMFLASLCLVAAITVTDEDLEIHPNVSGGNPNDSYMLNLIGDGDTGADVAMSVRTIPTTDTDYRLAISDNGGTERFSFTDAGYLGINDTTPSYVIDVNGDSRVGWNGDSTRIKILPSDFLPNEDDASGVMQYATDESDKGVVIRDSNCEMYAFVAIPEGYEATHLRLYGSDTDTVTVYESDIDDGNWSASLGSAGTGTEIDITDVSDNTTNFLVVEIDVDATDDIVYGGYVTIARQ